MRLYSSFLNRQAARDANSVFEAEHYVRRIEHDDDVLFELVRKEVKDDKELLSAHEHARIQDIIREEREEIKDIEDLVNQAFKIIREGMLLIHTQLDKLNDLIKEDEVLEKSGFPIEVADQLEDMLKKEIVSIMTHLRKMGFKDDKLLSKDAGDNPG